MIKKLYPVLCLLMLCSHVLFAQVAAWGGGADYNDFSFGFHFQYISSDFKILKTPDWQTPYFDKTSGTTVTTPLTAITSTSNPGFGVGFIARLRITDNLELRTTPALAFSDRTLTYQYQDDSKNVDKKINAALFETPLTLKIKSDRIGNMRAYLLGGVKYSVSFTGPKKEDANTPALDKVVNNQRGYASYEAGIGCDIYFNYFKFSPEIKLSNSIGNILVAGDNPYSKPLDRLFLHSIVFSIYFE